MWEMHDWKAIDLEVTSVNVLIQTVEDVSVPQNQQGGLRSEPSTGNKGLWDETEMSVPKASEGKHFQVDVVCMKCDKCYRKNNVTEEIGNVLMLPW